MLENIDKLKNNIYIYIYSPFHIFPSLIQLSDKTPYQSSENNVQQQNLHFVLKLTDNMVNDLANVLFTLPFITNLGVAYFSDKIK
jgi:hypothetical protein